jgi:hypothetical protein
MELRSWVWLINSRCLCDSRLNSHLRIQRGSRPSSVWETNETYEGGLTQHHLSIIEKKEILSSRTRELKQSMKTIGVKLLRRRRSMGVMRKEDRRHLMI